MAEMKTVLCFTTPNPYPLKYLVCYSKSDVLFLNETVIHSNKTDEFRYSLDFDNCLVVSSNGQSGVLSLFWSHSFKSKLHSPLLKDV